MWRGAKTALEENIKNAFFLRTRIEFIESFFDPSEISEIWITFPDPQPRESRERKRLTSHRFLDKYEGFLRKSGTIHLKTDAAGLYEYSLQVARDRNYQIDISTNKLYEDLKSLDLSEKDKAILGIPTHYEKMFADKGHVISYLKFKI